MSAPATRRVHLGWSAKCGTLYLRKRDANADATRGGLDKAYRVASLDLRPAAMEAHPVGNNQAMVNEAVAALTPGATEPTK